MSDAENIAAAEGMGDGLCLDRGGGCVAGGLNGAKHLFAEAKFVECHFVPECGKACRT